LAQKDIAECIAYSAMMVSNATDALEANGLCTIEKNGRVSSLRFPDSREELWQKAKDQMGSPVRKIHYVQGQLPGERPLLAGTSALSRNSMLSEGALPTVAMFHKDFRAKLDRGGLQGCPAEDMADLVVEAWNYDPKLLAGGETVDPFSLYLSLRDSPDERIQQELDQMVEDIAW
jgi:hypothetical protein